MNKKLLSISAFLLISISIFAQKPQKLTSNQIFEKIQKLNFLGTAFEQILISKSIKMPK